jgi:hypothetical protein
VQTVVVMFCALGQLVASWRLQSMMPYWAPPDKDWAYLALSIRSGSVMAYPSLHDFEYT